MKENQNTSIRYWLDNVGTPSHIVLEYTKNRSVAFAEAIKGIKNPLSEADIAEYYKEDPYTGVIATSLWLGKHRSIPREFSFLSGGEKNIRCQIRYWTKLLEKEGIRPAFYASAGRLCESRKPKDVETSVVFSLPPWELLHFIGYNLPVNKRPPILDIEKHYSLLKEAHSDMLHQWYTKDNAGNIVVKDKSQMDYIYFDYCRRISRAFYEHPNGCIDYHPMQLDVYVITGRAEHHFLRDLVDISLELKKMGYAVWDDYSHHCFKMHQSIRSEDMALRRHLIESAKCFLVYNYCWSLSSAAIHDIGVAIENGKPIIVVGEFDGVRLEKALNVKKKFPWVTVENWDMMMKHLVSICEKQPPVSAVKRVKEKSKLQQSNDPIPMQSKRTGKWGYCDKEGRSRCQYNYDKTYLFADGMGRMSVDGKYGYMGLNVREAILPQYAHARDFCCGLAPVAYESRGPVNKQKWGYIDKENNLIVPYDYDDADVFEPCGLARVKIGDKYGIIDTKGKMVIPVEYDNIIIEGIGHKAPGRIKRGGKYGLWTKPDWWTIILWTNCNRRRLPTMPKWYFRGTMTNYRRWEQGSRSRRLSKREQGQPIWRTFGDSGTWNFWRLCASPSRAIPSRPMRYWRSGVTSEKSATVMTEGVRLGTSWDKRDWRITKISCFSCPRTEAGRNTTTRYVGIISAPANWRKEPPSKSLLITGKRT